MEEESRHGRTQREELSLSEAAKHLLEESRVVLPGIQMLFGFQLMVVFNAGFDEKLTQREQHLHLVAIILVTIAAAIIMTPAAYHRNKPREVSTEVIQVSRRLLTWSMVPLAVGIALDIYLVARVILDPISAMLIAAALLAVFVTLWFVFPRVKALHRMVVGGK